MVNFRKMLWMCFLGSLLATGAMAALVAYSFAGDAPVAPPNDRGYQNERAPLPGRLNALLVSEGVEVTIEPAGTKRCPTCGAIEDASGVAVTVDAAGVDVTVDPGGVDVTVSPACPPGSGADPYAGRYDEDSADYDEYADEGGGGDHKLFGFLGKLRGGGGEGPLKRLFGKLRGRRGR